MYARYITTDLAVGKVGFPGRLKSPGQPSATRESQSQMIGPGEWSDIEHIVVFPMCPCNSNALHHLYASAFSHSSDAIRTL